MSGEYTISEDRDYKNGNGIRAYIKDGKFICDVADECGNAGGEWFCDIELLRYHIEQYKQGNKTSLSCKTPLSRERDMLKGEVRGLEIRNEVLERRNAKLENIIVDLVKTINTQTAMMKPVVFVAEDEDKVAKIKKFLNENALDI